MSIAQPLKNWQTVDTAIIVVETNKVNMNPEYLWLEKEFVEQAHDYIIEEIGGINGLRDTSLLESGVNRPQNVHYYEGEENIFNLAAAYAESIAKNHPFADGNKRTAFLSAGAFLENNGYKLDPRLSREYVEGIDSLTQGKCKRSDLAEILRKGCSGGTPKHNHKLASNNETAEQDTSEASGSIRETLGIGFAMLSSHVIQLLKSINFEPPGKVSTTDKLRVGEEVHSDIMDAAKSRNGNLKTAEITKQLQLAFDF